MVLEYAIKYKASDIHIEPREKKIAVRFRIYGVLSEKLTIPRKLGNSIVSRIKILSNLQIDEKRVPQDGRFQVKSGNQLIDIRVSVMPTVYGEKIVMRLLEKGGGTMEIKDTGLRGPAYKIFIENLAKTQGIILVTGPTGSGKTQTLASSLKILNKPEVNIMTIEDPVEIRVDGVTQVQVNKAVELTFAKALRSFLRQDPDIMMVGEIRDTETAELATQAALTGHLVLSTLHTNSAAGALPRLLDMKVEPFLIASTVNLVMAQRLTRKICEYCKEAYQVPVEVVKEIHKTLSGLRGFDLYSYPRNEEKLKENVEDDVVFLYKGKGCSKCNNTGYIGRIGIFEAMLITPKIGQLIMQQRSADEVERRAVEEGMITIKQDGFMKALEGVTTLEEVLRVIN
ncbi:MAG: Type IV-A pilus assembly ATPase PilB [candidate division WS6 bacterium GW2011_GWA2_37_6]|uniref:Type IV-A pilus assembly ATPase PilB n=1 Tax=candidate division WS6 bacterium GW2011_GWA2_37_6 TaxID=1619087 RepID=A0A0G0K0T6_9BACT|nr:MAG: Type IV-A pilus assembly ATPase PilB [candidate division WS6 bacterium GW2011_GWA2_37_6]